MELKKDCRKWDALIGLLLSHQEVSQLSYCNSLKGVVIFMYLFAAIITVITGLITIIDIFVGISDINEGMRVFVGLNRVLFFASLLFFIGSSIEADKNKKTH